MQRYRATKISIPDQAAFPSAETIDSYRESLHQKYNFSPPLEYYVEGLPFSWRGDSELLKVGNSFSMVRDNRNGEKIDGLFTTSVVVSISKDNGEGYTLFTTKNSIYKLELITE